MKMSLSKYEMETVIRFDESDSTATIYTYNRALKNRLRVLSEKQPVLVCMKEGDGLGGVAYTLPKKCIRIAQPRVVSEAQKARLRDIGFKSRGGE